MRAPSGAQDEQPVVQDKEQQAGNIPVGVKSTPPEGAMSHWWKEMNRPKDFPDPLTDKDAINEIIGASIGGPGMKLVHEGEEAIEHGAVPALKKAYEYLQPGKKAESIMQELGGGAETAEQNAEQLGKRIKTSHDSALKEALDSKKNVMGKVSDEKLFDPKTSKVKYVTKQFEDDELTKLHENFGKNPTFKNADELQSELGNAIGEYKHESKIRKLKNSEKKDFKLVKETRDKLNKFQDSFLESRGDNLKNEYDTFKRKYRENVVPYKSVKSIKDFLVDKEKGLTKAKIASTFKEAEKSSSVKKILEDIGPSGKNNILFNALIGSHAAGPEALAQAIEKARKVGGYEKYITPEIKKMGEQLASQTKYSGHIANALKGLAGYGAGSFVGGPIAGIAGAMAPFAVKGAKTLYKASKK